MGWRGDTPFLLPDPLFTRDIIILFIIRGRVTHLAWPFPVFNTGIVFRGSAKNRITQAHGERTVGTVKNIRALFVHEPEITVPDDSPIQVFPFGGIFGLNTLAWL